MENSTEPKSSPSDKPSELDQIAAIMGAHGVEFIVIGGQAETLMGSPRVTFDVDLCYRRTRENCQRLATALQQLQAKLRGVPDAVPFLLDDRTIEMGCNFTFNTSVINLDLLGYVEPIGDYEEVLRAAEEYAIGAGLLVKVIGLDDLIRIKTTIKRFKDTESMFQLLAIKRVRDATGQR